MNENNETKRGKALLRRAFPEVATSPRFRASESREQFDAFAGLVDDHRRHVRAAPGAANVAHREQFSGRAKSLWLRRTEMKKRERALVVSWSRFKKRETTKTPTGPHESLRLTGKPLGVRASLR